MLSAMGLSLVLISTILVLILTIVVVIVMGVFASKTHFPVDGKVSSTLPSFKNRF